MDQPLISVIIPVYNMELYLERCLDSVLNNTYRKLEVICIDDGSKDRSLEILRRYEAADPRVVVIAKENGGVSSARNAGLDRMTGEFVTFVDPDDFVHPQYVEVLLAAQRLSGSDNIIGKFLQTRSTEALNDYPRYALSAHDIDIISAVDACRYSVANSGVSCKLISRDSIGNVRFPKEFSYGEDTLFFLDLYSMQPYMKVGIIPHALYYYFVGRADSLVHTRRDRDIIRYLSALADKSTVKETERVYLETLIRRGLYFRYYYTYIQAEPDISKQIGKILFQRIKQLMCSSLFSFHFKATRTIFIIFPGIDHQYRIFRDSSLKKQEQIQKAELALKATKNYQSMQ